jgi:hypothetical protein
MRHHLRNLNGPLNQMSSRLPSAWTAHSPAARRQRIPCVYGFCLCACLSERPVPVCYYREPPTLGRAQVPYPQAPVDVGGDQEPIYAASRPPSPSDASYARLRPTEQSAAAPLPPPKRQDKKTKASRPTAPRWSRANDHRLLKCGRGVLARDIGAHCCQPLGHTSWGTFSGNTE